MQVRLSRSTLAFMGTEKGIRTRPGQLETAENSPSSPLHTYPSSSVHFPEYSPCSSRSPSLPLRLCSPPSLSLRPPLPSSRCVALPSNFSDIGPANSPSIHRRVLLKSTDTSSSAPTPTSAATATTSASSTASARTSRPASRTTSAASARTAAGSATCTCTSATTLSSRVHFKSGSQRLQLQQRPELVGGVLPGYLVPWLGQQRVQLFPMLPRLSDYTGTSANTPLYTS